MISGERSYDFSNTVQTATGQIRGVEMLLRGSGAGIYVRSLSGTFGAGQVISADARILLFPPVFTVFVGAGKRVAGQLQLNPTVFYVGMAGISSTVNIGGTGLRTFVSGAVLIAPNKSVSGSSAAAVDNMGTGLEGEAAVLYRIPRVPIFVQIGYRTEVFMWKVGTMEYPEEVRGIRVGGGIQFGGY